MKALDTSVLLALLEGDRSARELVRRLREEELATTELNVLELVHVLTRGSKRLRSHRRDALDRMTRKLTVLPIDSRAMSAVRRSAIRGRLGDTFTVTAMAGALEAAGCDELFTGEPGNWGGISAFKIAKFTRHRTK